MSSSDNGASDDQVRVGHVEREQVVELLQGSVGGGYLTLDEFEHRVTLVHEATNRGDLRAVLADLPAAQQSPVAPQAEVGPGISAANPETISGDWTATVRKRGVWQVPPALQLEGSMATIELDFTECRLPATGVDLRITATWTTVRLKVASQTPVDTSAYEQTSWGSFKDKAGPPVGTAGPAIRISGRPSATTLIIRRHKA